MIKIYTAFIACSLLLLLNCKNNSEKYEVGQEWNYKTRLGEENSTLKILKIEEFKKDGKVIHISISGLKMNNPHIKERIVRELVHIPISEKALSQSVTTIKNVDSELPDYHEGYLYWKEEFEKDKAGIFSISVSEIVEGMEEVMLSGNMIQ